MEGAPINNAGDGLAPQSSKVRLSKSQLRTAPSDASIRSKSGGDVRKNPLDVLSRTNVRQQAERRSGLQDVDEDFLTSNIFARPTRARSARELNDSFATERLLPTDPQHVITGQPPKQMPVAGMPTYAQPATAGLPSNPHAAGQHGHHHYHASYGQPQMVQAQTVQQQQQQQAANLVAAQQQQAVAQQQQHQQAAAVLAAQQQQQAAAQQQQQQQQAANLAAAQQQARVPAGYVENNQSEPDMCTTCPNCQATIYLLRQGATPVMDNNHEQGRN